ncbi:hypothetical protein FRC06_007158, partial [Ceratobasidium sp. 370]
MSSEQDVLQPPRPIGLSSARDSMATANSSAAPSVKAHDSSSFMGAVVPELPHSSEKPAKKRNTLVYALVGVAALAVIVVAVVVPVYFKVVKHKDSSTSSASPGSSGGAPPGSTPGAGNNPTSGGTVTSGGDGSTVTKDDGTTFTYNNKFGGFWVFDPTNPFNNSAQAQSWTPPLNKPWKFGEDLIRGVNIGGWLVLEPFISPALYEPYQPTNPKFSGIRAVDEWTLCQAIAANKSSGGVAKNGFNHSGKLGGVNWLEGVMGIANAQRSLNIIRTITEFISQDQYKDVVVMFGVVNEPQVSTIGQDVITSFYLEMHDMMRNITGLGKGPFISIHNGFQAFSTWNNFLPGSDRIALDGHPYFCFARMLATPLSSQVNRPCTEWGNDFNNTMDSYGFVAAGEWSLSFNDCAYYLNGANAGYRYDGTLPRYTGPRVGSCETWLDADTWTDKVKADLKQLALSHMDATQNHFFWTWKIGASDRTGKVNAPLWSYSLGVKGGWLPLDPREATGVCKNTNPRSGPLKPTQTSYVSQTIAAGVRAANRFPPASISGGANAAALPTYTATGTPITLAPPTFTAATVSAGSGWVGGSGGWTGDYVPVDG